MERNADFHDEQFKKKLVRVADTGVEKMKTDVSMYPVSPERNISQTNSKGKPAVSWFEWYVEQTAKPLKRNSMDADPKME